MTASNIVNAWGLVRSFGLIRAVDEVDLAITPGQIVALVGPPGSGKKTLLGLLSGHLVSDEGSIAIKGRDATRSTLAERAKQGLVRVLDVEALYDELTIADHVLAVARNSAPSETGLYSQWHTDSQYLRRGLVSLGDTGLDAPMPTQVATLNLAQRRQLVFGLTAMEAFDLVLWDLPFQGLARRDCEGIEALMRRRREEGRSILFSATTVAEGVADRVLTLREGRLLSLSS